MRRPLGTWILLFDTRSLDGAYGCGREKEWQPNIVLRVEARSIASTQTNDGFSAGRPSILSTRIRYLVASCG